ncbi:MAG: PTS sugar transporter subunit IIA [Algisphaera sp.]
MKLRDFVIDDAILPELAASTRDDAIAEMLDALVAAKAVPKKLRDPLLELLLTREKNGSTGFGKGVAVPHVKHPDVKKMCSTIANSGPGVDFNALDKQPVFSLFMLVSPADQPDQHLQAMETLFSNLQKDTFRSFLRQSQDVAAITSLLDEADNGEI